MEMKDLASLALITTLLIFNLGCTEQKELSIELEDEEEYWVFLIYQGISDLDTAKEYTRIYVVLEEKTEENPIDSLIRMRYETDDQGLGEIVGYLQEMGLTNDEVILLSLPLTYQKDQWSEFIGNMVAIDDYIINRMGYKGIPIRKAGVDKTYELWEAEDATGPAQH